VKQVLLIVIVVTCAGCGPVTVTSGDSITYAELEQFFRKHKIDGNHAAALKKLSFVGDVYVITIHGYPNNLEVCESLAAPMRTGNLLWSDIPGVYHCELLE